MALAYFPDGVQTTKLFSGQSGGLVYEPNGLVTSGGLSVLTMSSTVLLATNAGTSALFNFQATIKSQSTPRNPGSLYVFACQPQYDLSNSFVGAALSRIIGGLYFAPNFLRPVGASTITWSSVNAVLLEQIGVASGFTLTDYRGMLFEVPLISAGAAIGTLTGIHLKNFDALIGAGLTTALSLRSEGSLTQLRHAGPGVFGADAASSGPAFALEVQSTTASLCPARMTTAQILAAFGNPNPAVAFNGIVVYDTTANTMKYCKNGLYLAW